MSQTAMADERGITVAQAVLFDELGGPEVLRLEEVTVGEPAESEVRIRFEAIGLNRAEAFFREGRYYYKPTLPSSRIGCEASGVVEAVGLGVDGLRVGDRVAVYPGPFSMSRHGVYGTHGIVPAKAVLRQPDALDAVHGAAVWTALMTSYGALVEVGGTGPDNTVLIIAASGSVGLAAIQIANAVGAIPVATTRTEAKRDRLLEAGAAHVIVTGEGTDLVKEIQSVTDGRGADLVFDPVGGPGIMEVARTVAPGGKLIEYSWLDGRPTPLPLNWPLNIHCYAHTAVTGSQAALDRAIAFIKDGLDQGTLTAIVDRTFELPEIVEAHRYLESNAQLGKIVVTVPR